MTKKTRIRVARIAAGAVIAAGASLTAAGAASAFEIGVSAGANDGGVGLDVGVTDGDEPTEGPTEPEEPTDPPTTIPEQPSAEPTLPEEPTTEPTEPTEPTEEPSETAPGGGTGGGNGGGGNGGGTGGNAADPNGGPSTQEEGSSALTDTGDEAPAPSAQSNGKELAETGAAEMTFLVVGAATMIAGGIGFRVLPRLMTGRGGAAA
ncbi:LPXTG cell wall anchor domain-containing protein [Streptomyces viridosporus]|uniref:LPXTG cell wall anchor domain-containing protein n=1 Tax=Streptomyces viridosporus TaxID=67581 RepID=UPI0009C09770|nr:LPXTG cell wall anchor domain-containing protein [Streptomyces viridosporus]